MQLALITEVSSKPERKLNYRSVTLSQRDLEIFEFIIDMKFASLEDIYRKFFRFTLATEPTKNDFWARKRLFQLEQGKFLKAHKAESDKINYYTATFKAYYALSTINPERAITKPIGGFDYRTFGHDKMVCKCRLDLEEVLKVTSWLSDRKLKSSFELSGGLSSVHVPDAIYTLPSGERVALEVEIARKSKARYLDKIKKYVSVLRSQDPSKKKFDVVQIVCTQEPVFKFLVQNTKIYGSLFRVQALNDLIAELSGGHNAESK